MSKKQGAIKKSLETNSESRTQIKTRTRSITDASSEQQGKAELRERKVVLDRRGAGDRPSKVSQNASSRVLPSKVIIGDATARSKTVHRNSTSSTARSTHEGSPRVTNHVTNKSTTSRTHSESIRKVTSSKEVDRSKAREKNRTGYTEKRGTSDIYIPKAQTSKYGSKSTDETRVKNTESSQVKDRGRRSEPKKTETGKESRHRLPSQERRKSRTLSPSEVKVLHSNANKSNVVRKTTSTTLPVKNNPKIDNASNNADSEYEYEDDFEDYESDFQECTDSEASEVSEASDNSRITPMLDPIELRTEQQKKVVSSGESRKTEEEHMLDSGHYELAEARKRAARVESMTANQSKTPSPPELRQPVNKAYREETTTETKSLPLSTDEGFEEDRSGDFAKSPPLSQVVFIDFQKAKKESPIKKSQVTLSRGKELLQMIKLDTVNWSLLECSPISYGEFIRIYGKLNTQQMSTQTKEDNLDIEIQTDEINCSNKWTQFPVKCRNRLKNNEDVKRFKMEQIGVGDDRDEESNLHSTKPSFDIIRLNEFMERAGKVMLAILEETRLGGNVLQSDVHELPFSEGVVNLSVNSVTFLTGRPVTIIHYSEVLNKVLLSIHSTTDEEVETSNKQDYLTDCCIGCLWNMSEPSKPTKLFYSPCPVTACCFHPTNYNLIFAGLQDGSMSLWDLKEDEMWHRKVTDKANESDWIIRSPTYVTAGNPEIDGHKSEIVAIHVLSKIEEEPIEASYNKFVPIQICSLDSDGYLIIWSTFRNIGSATNDLGLSYWGNVKLTKSQEISLGSRKTKIKSYLNGFVDMQVDSISPNNLYIGTNSTNIMHATCVGTKTSPPVYKAREMDQCGGVTCIERCPFEQSYFLVGCDDGAIRLHSLHAERPLLQLKDENCAASVKSLQWSKTKPFTVYILDNESKIHVWDLSSSDIYPMFTISTKTWGHVCSMTLSPCKCDRDMTNQYMALGTETGNVEIHKLNKDFCHSRRKDLRQELNTFLRYVSIL